MGTALQDASGADPSGPDSCHADIRKFALHAFLELFGRLMLSGSDGGSPGIWPNCRIGRVRWNGRDADFCEMLSIMALSKTLSSIPYVVSVSYVSDIDGQHLVIMHDCSGNATAVDQIMDAIAGLEDKIRRPYPAPWILGAGEPVPSFEEDAIAVYER